MLSVTRRRGTLSATANAAIILVFARRRRISGWRGIQVPFSFGCEGSLTLQHEVRE